MRTVNLLIFFFAGISFIGFVDATYLTVNHYLGNYLVCPINFECQTVLTSKYSTIFKIPISLFGSIYYLILFILATAAFLIKDKLILWGAYLSPAGFLFSVYLMLIQFFVIKELCLYCVFSAIASSVLFILGILIIKTLKFYKNNFPETN